MKPTQQRPQAPPEDVPTVGELVAKILDARIEDVCVPPEVQDVFKLRAATRRVLEAHLHPHDEDRLLRALARQAARASLALWALEAMEAEILEPDPPELLPPDVVSRAGTLRRWGHSACPTCHQGLVSEYETDRDGRRKEWAKKDREVRRDALHQELAS